MFNQWPKHVKLKYKWSKWPKCHKRNWVSPYFFLDNEREDLESDNKIDDFLSELLKNFWRRRKVWRWYKWKQKLLGHGIVPIIRMAEELKNMSPDSKKVKKYILDSLTVLMNVFFEILVNRRLFMKPFICKRNHQLCNRTENIRENKLFEDVGKDLKT